MLSTRPVISFPQFQAPWQECDFGEFGTIVKGGTPSTLISEYWDGDVNWFTPAEIDSDGGGVVTESVRKISRLGLKNSSVKLLPPGVLLISSRATIGKVAVTSTPGGMNNGFTGLIPRNSASLWFLYAWVLGHKHLLLEKSAGSIFPDINFKDLASLAVQKPGLTEQQEIGEFFKKLDALIAGEKAKVEKLLQFKRGMLTKMFPRPGSNTPELRFSGFAQNWRECAFGEFGLIVSGGTPASTVPDYWDGDINWFTPAEIDRDGAGAVTESVRKISSLGLKNSPAKLLPPGTLLITRRATVGNVGVTTMPAATNEGFTSLIPHNSDSLWFLYAWVLGHRDLLLEKSAGTTFLGISSKNLANRVVKFPSIAEQQAIGSYFKKLDTLIAAQKAKLHKLQQLKQALLKHMFVS